MLERFTKAARAVVTDARERAVEATASEVRPEHLLAALLQHKDCLAARVVEGLGVKPTALQELLERQRLHHVDGLDRDDADALRAIGIDLDEVVRRIDRNLGGLAGPRRTGRVRYARSSRKVLELALREAIALRHNYIGTEHLLLALLRGGDRVTGDTFAELGITHGAVRDAVVAALRRAG